MDRVSHILDHQTSTDPDSAPDQTVLRIVFDQGEVELYGQEARAFRYWYRQIARNIGPHRDRSGRELVNPDEQVRRAVEILVRKIDECAFVDPQIHQLAHKVKNLVMSFSSGDLPAVSCRDFDRNVGNLAQE
jgi:hypothetical protein